MAAPKTPWSRTPAQASANADAPRAAVSSTETLSRRAFVRASALASAALLFGGCSANLGSSAPDQTAALSEPQPNSKARPQKPVRIGLLLPMSGYGPAAVTAKGMKQAAEMALFEIDNPLVQLIVKDDSGTPTGAASAATEAIAEGAEIIVGPLTSASTAAAAVVARKAKVPILSFSNDRRAAGNGVYLMPILPDQEVERIVSFAAKQGRRRFAALVPDDDYGRVVEVAFRGSVTKNGGTIASVVYFPLDPNAMPAQIRTLSDEMRQGADTAMPVDTLLIAGTADALTQIGALFAYAGIDTSRIKPIGTASWDYPNASRNPAFAGGWFSAPDPHGWQDFAQRFSRSFGATPPRLSSLSYDAVSLAISLSGNEPGQRYTAANIERATGFLGVDGTFRFTPAGIIDRGLAVLEMQAFTASIIEPAPGAAPNAAPASTPKPSASAAPTPGPVAATPAAAAN